MIRLGLCCQFLDSPIQLRTATHRYVATLDRKNRRAYLAEIAGHNAGALARAYDIRLSLHPDQFVVLNSEREPVVRSAVQDLELQAEVAELTGADVIVLHGGGAGGGIPAAVERLKDAVDA